VLEARAVMKGPAHRHVLEGESDIGCCRVPASRGSPRRIRSPSSTRTLRVTRKDRSGSHRVRVGRLGSQGRNNDLAEQLKVTGEIRMRPMLTGEIL
jgi:hypothetical protein